MSDRSSLERVKDYIGCAMELAPDPVSALRILWYETKNLRVQLGLGRHDPTRLYSLRTVYGPLHFRDNFGDITNLPDVLYHGPYRVDRVEGEGVILDVGANIGLVARWLSIHNPNRAIYCFEPLEDNARMIRKNCPSARVLTVAVGESAGRLKLQADPAQVMASSISTEWETDAIEVPSITLDDFADEYGISRVAFLKVDTEGMEDEILRGARHLLDRTSRVALETHGKERHQAVVRTLSERGFGVEEHFQGATGMVFARQ